MSFCLSSYKRCSRLLKCDASFAKGFLSNILQSILCLRGVNVAKTKKADSSQNFSKLMANLSPSGNLKRNIAWKAIKRHSVYRGPAVQEKPIEPGPGGSGTPESHCQPPGVPGYALLAEPDALWRHPPHRGEPIAGRGYQLGGGSCHHTPPRQQDGRRACGSPAWREGHPQARPPHPPQLRDTSLLRSRYMVPARRKDAASFWQSAGLPRSAKTHLQG